MTDTPTYTPEQVVPLLVAKVAELGDHKTASKAWGCTPQLVYMVLNGKRAPSDRMLASVGLEKVPPAPLAYRKIEAPHG